MRHNTLKHEIRKWPVSCPNQESPDVPLWSVTTKLGLDTIALGTIPMVTCPGASNLCAQVCYARRGRRFDSIGKSQSVRTSWLSYVTRDERRRSAAIDYTIDSIASLAIRAGVSKVRLNWSGDLWSPEVVRFFSDVSWALPGIDFWISTRGHRVPALLSELVKWRARVANTTIRPSGDTEPPVVPGLDGGTAILLPDMPAPAGAFICPAIVNHDTCAAHACTACFGYGSADRATPILYPLH